MRPLRRSFITLLVLGIGAAAAAPHRAPGRLDGVVTLSSRLTTARQRVRVYDEPGAVPTQAPADDRSLANLVLYLDSVPGPTGEPARSGSAMMRQRGERFVPHVLPVLVGTAVEFPNEDPIYHNVFSLSRARTFDLARYPRGQSRTVRFQSPGIATDVRIESGGVTRLDLHIPLPEPEP